MSARREPGTQRHSVFHRSLCAHVSECFGGMSQFQQRANIKFMFKVERSAKETLQALVCLWRHCFEEIYCLRVVPSIWERPRNTGRRTSQWTPFHVPKRRKCCESEDARSKWPANDRCSDRCGSSVVRWSESVRRKRPQKWKNDWALHHDNAPSHTAMAVKQFLAKNNIPIVPHLPYSPDLALSDFWLFPPLKTGLSRTSFRNGGRHQRKRRRETGRNQKRF
jgi:hypothetical protein